MLGEIREDFAVYDDALFLYLPHKFGVRDAFGVQSGIDFDYPEISTITLFVSAVSKGVRASMHQCLVCGGFVCGTAETITFCLTQNISTMF